MMGEVSGVRSAGRRVAGNRPGHSDAGRWSPSGLVLRHPDGRLFTEAHQSRVMNADRMTNAEYGAFLARDLPPMTDEEARAAALILASVGSEAPPD